MKRVRAVTEKGHRKKNHYQVRCFYSKGAFLILLWVLLTSVAGIIVRHKVFYDTNTISKWLIIFLAFFGLLGSVLSGWLADKKLGNYKVLKLANVLLFTAQITGCTYFLVSNYVQNVYIVNSLYCVFGSLYAVGIMASVITSLQLGLDQMPEASSSSITSFIAWYIFSNYAGFWIAFSVMYSFESCIHQTKMFNLTNSIQLLLILPPLCLGIILVSDFLLFKRWLKIEPKSPQSLKTIYHVLKFAWKNKSPLNRSALTYWEEDTPSRMDLGKSRYGGPFTTEQVEDVKTILRLLLLTLSFWFISFPLVSDDPQPGTLVNILSSTNCTSHLISLVTFNSSFYVMLCILINEFIIYPILKNKFPSILRRIGLVSFATTVVYTTAFVFYLMHFLKKLQDKTMIIISILTLISSGLLIPLMFGAVLELVCAQAPYKMRGLSTGYATLLVVPFIALKLKSVSNPTVVLAIFGAKSISSIFGFILFCFLARWYKRRVRDEEYNVHRVVEEVYDRYLSARN